MAEEGLVPQKESAIRAWLKDEGFTAGSLRSEEEMSDGRRMCPMARACDEGQIKICMWLYDNGAAEDIRRANERGYTPMHYACSKGHLLVCQWLYEMGEAEEIFVANLNGWTPMHMACQGGYLPICKWLYKVGAVADITRKDYGGETPMWWACENNHLSICHWLIFNGAENDPTTDHVGQAIVRRDTQQGTRHRPALLTWARRIVDTHDNFLNIFLRASVLVPSSQLHVCPSARCRLPQLSQCVLERVSSFLGVEIGRRLRNVREFKEALEVGRWTWGRWKC